VSESDPVRCEAHGETRATYMCCHLATGVACGFHADASPDDPWPDAWCDLCEERFQAEGSEWTPALEELADISLLCTHCYDAARERNEEVPARARGQRARLGEAEIQDLLHHALHELQDLQRRSEERHHWQGHARWDIDPDHGVLVFSDPQRGKLLADCRYVGSYSTRSRTFQWLWETEPEAREADEIARLRTFGEVRGIAQLTTPSFECDEHEAWRMCAIAAYLLGADGAYRPPSGRQYWFVLLSNWRLAS
jgi:hypothetical protein